MSKQFDELMDVLKTLRGENGCPWDRKQTFESLRRYLLEEAYEVIEAVEENNIVNLKEELGDVIMLCGLYSRIAEEQELFTMDEVLEDVKNKLIYRHPHVFGNEKATNEDEANKNWEKQKISSKKDKNKSILSGIPKSLPALLQAHRVQDKAAYVGFDWENINDVFAKVREEVKELEEAWHMQKSNEIEEEIGDLIFALVNLTRFLKKNPEDIVKQTVEKFKNRFFYIEQAVEASGRNLTDLTLNEMDKLWNDAKKKEDK